MISGHPQTSEKESGHLCGQPLKIACVFFLMPQKDYGYLQCV